MSPPTCWYRGGQWCCNDRRGVFEGDARTPVWFRLSIDGTGLVRHARMQAPGHFMEQTFDDVNAPLTISAPPGT
jgi:hypothetical protein